MEPIRRFLFWLLDGTRGGPMRIRLLGLLAAKPMNLRQLALAAGVDYSTVEHHIRLLEKHAIVECVGEGYGKLYMVSEEPLVRDYITQKNKGEGYGTEGKGKKDAKRR